MPAKLVLESLDIRQFRGLRELRIERLGRVNLIVGKNNVGKTTVLEALRLYAQPGNPDVLLDLFEARDEITANSARFNSREPKLIPIEGLFFGRQATLGATPRIRIGPIGADEKTLSIGLKLDGSPWDAGDGPQSLPSSASEDRNIDRSIGLAFQLGPLRWFIPVTDTREFVRHRRVGVVQWRSGTSEGIITPSFFIGANGLGQVQIGRLWDAIALTELEEEVVASLRVIAPPEIERLSLVANDEYSRSRSVLVKIREYGRPITLRSMGDGVNRLFGIVLALVNARDGFLLVDEIENGIHYSVQPEIWRFIFEVAPRLNVQVFATTHSWDCLKAFQLAAAESEEEGVVVQLDLKDGQVRTRQLDERELGIAVRGQIEIR